MSAFFVIECAASLHFHIELIKHLNPSSPELLSGKEKGRCERTISLSGLRTDFFDALTVVSFQTIFASGLSFSRA